MAYSNVPIGTANPGCIVILVDQSLSMDEEWEKGTKAEGATRAVNRVIGELVIAGRAGETIKDRCHVSVIGYGEQVECIVDGMISEVAKSLIEVQKVKKSIPDGAGGIVEVEVGMPIWLQPEAGNGTPMHEAFERAAEIIQQWCDDKPDGFPPIVINITDGAAGHPDLTAMVVREVMDLGTTDGKVLVFNIHISNTNNKNLVIFPSSTAQFVGDSLSEDYDLAEFLFSLSSVLPAPLREAAQAADLRAEPDARCFTNNANQATMIKILQFGTLGVTQVHALPEPLER